MSYTNLLKRQVRNAFNAAKDLAMPITLQQKNVSEFNFASGLPVETSLTTLDTKYVLLEDGRKEGTDNPSRYKQILISAEDISDPDIYDKAIINGEIWTIVPPYENNGFTITLMLNKEA